MVKSPCQLVSDLLDGKKIVFIMTLIFLTHASVTSRRLHQLDIQTSTTPTDTSQSQTFLPHSLLQRGETSHDLSRSTETLTVVNSQFVTQASDVREVYSLNRRQKITTLNQYDFPTTKPFYAQMKSETLNKDTQHRKPSSEALHKHIKEDMPLSTSSYWTKAWNERRPSFKMGDSKLNEETLTLPPTGQALIRMKNSSYKEKQGLELIVNDSLVSNTTSSTMPIPLSENSLIEKVHKVENNISATETFITKVSNTINTIHKDKIKYSHGKNSSIFRRHAYTNSTNNKNTQKSPHLFIYGSNKSDIFVQNDHEVNYYSELNKELNNTTTNQWTTKSSDVNQFSSPPFTSSLSYFPVFPNENLEELDLTDENDVYIDINTTVTDDDMLVNDQEIGLSIDLNLNESNIDVYTSPQDLQIEKPFNYEINMHKNISYVNRTVDIYGIQRNFTSVSDMNSTGFDLKLDSSEVELSTVSEHSIIRKLKSAIKAIFPDYSKQEKNAFAKLTNKNLATNFKGTGSGKSVKLLSKASRQKKDNLKVQKNDSSLAYSDSFARQHNSTKQLSAVYMSENFTNDINISAFRNNTSSDFETYTFNSSFEQSETTKPLLKVFHTIHPTGARLRNSRFKMNNGTLDKTQISFIKFNYSHYNSNSSNLTDNINHMKFSKSLGEFYNSDNYSVNSSNEISLNNSKSTEVNVDETSNLNENVTRKFVHQSVNSTKDYKFTTFETAFVENFNFSTESGVIFAQNITDSNLRLRLGEIFEVMYSTSETVESRNISVEVPPTSKSRVGESVYDVSETFTSDASVIPVRSDNASDGLPGWPVKLSAEVSGDLILGGLMMVHEREDTITCGKIMPQGGIQALETMLYTLDVLNREPKMIPNVTIGAHILDDCDKDTYGLEMAVDFIKAKEIRNQFLKVNDLISSVKKLILKSSSRIAAFKGKCPNLPLLPAPILTRWGTWLGAVQYYSENVDSIDKVVNSFSENDFRCIKVAQNVLREKELRKDLAYIRANFTFLAKTIKQLESSKRSLTESMSILRKAECQLKQASGKVGKNASKKIEIVLARNRGYAVLKNVSDFLMSVM